VFGVLSPRYEAEVVGYFRREWFLAFPLHPLFRFAYFLIVVLASVQIPADIAPLSVESKPYGLEVTCRCWGVLLTGVSPS